MKIELLKLAVFAAYLLLAYVAHRLFGLDFFNLVAFLALVLAVDLRVEAWERDKEPHVPTK